MFKCKIFSYYFDQIVRSGLNFYKSEKLAMSNNANIKNYLYTHYRADIDGLRAIAIISVIIFHAFPNILSGGFFGVDIFFVISGFLISSILIKNLENNSFRFIDFYQRRINRIFPSLLLILTLCPIWGFFFSTNLELNYLGKHLAGAAVFASNLVYWKESGYFDVSSELKPLLHLWSLGIEEQFYIFWPLILWFAWRYRHHALKIILITFACSVIINAYQTQTDTTAQFFSPLPRAWQLIAGGLLAYANSRYTKRIEIITNLTSNWMSFIGLVVIFFSITMISKDQSYIGFWAFLPTLGSFLIIAAGSNGLINRSILSSHLCIWIGKISYPLYLWHWPLLTFARIAENQIPSIETRIILILVSIILSDLTYRFFEKPFRTTNVTSTRSTVLLVMLMLLGLIGYTIFANETYPFRVLSPNDFLIIRHSFQSNDKTDCKDIELSTKTPLYCAYNPQSEIMIIGDSHAAHFNYGLSNGPNNKYHNVSIFGIVGFLGLCSIDRELTKEDDCYKYKQVVFSILKENTNIKYVIISAWHQVVEKASEPQYERIYQLYEKIINKLENLGKKAIFVIDNQTLIDSSQKCEVSSLKLRNMLSKVPKYCKSLEPNDWLPTIRSDAIAEKLRTTFPNLIFFNPRQLLCEKNSCSIYKGNKILYADEHHYSTYGSELVAPYLIEIIEKDSSSLR